MTITFMGGTIEIERMETLNQMLEMFKMYKGSQGYYGRLYEKLEQAKAESEVRKWQRVNA